VSHELIIVLLGLLQQNTLHYIMYMYFVIIATSRTAIKDGNCTYKAIFFEFWRRRWETPIETEKVSTQQNLGMFTYSC